jgi:hypothetical protein
VAVSADHTIYVAMRCVNTVFVSKSLDGGLTFGASVPTGISGQGTAISQSDVSIAVNEAGTVFLAATTTSGSLLLTRSTDASATWSSPLLLDTGMEGAWGAHVTVNGNNVFVSAKKAATKQTHLFRNGALGVGAFATTQIAFTTNTSGDVVIDPSNGNVWAVADNNGAPVIKRSIDSGGSFGNPSFPAAAISHSTWSAGGSTLFGAGSGGTESSIWLFQTANPAVFTKVTGVVASPAAGSRSISADALGNLYSAAVSADGTVYIERVAANATTTTSSRAIGSAGSYPSVVAVDGNAAVVAFTSFDSVYVTVQKY